MPLPPNQVLNGPCLTQNLLTSYGVSNFRTNDRGLTNAYRFLESITYHDVFIYFTGTHCHRQRADAVGRSTLRNVEQCSNDQIKKCEVTSVGGLPSIMQFTTSIAMRRLVEMTITDPSERPCGVLPHHAHAPQASEAFTRSRIGPISRDGPGVDAPTLSQAFAKPGRSAGYLSMGGDRRTANIPG
jgi:hypothetical protein